MKTPPLMDRWMRLAVSRRAAIIVIVFASALLGLLASPGTAAAQTCVDDLTGVTNNCTANDVSFGQIDVLDAVLPTCAFEGQLITVTLRTRLTAGASERYDLGLFIAQDGGNARTGACFHDALRPVSGSSVYSATSGVGPFYNAELTDPADVCGDLEQNVLTTYDLQPISIVCRDADNDGFLDVGAVVSWDNVDNNTCASAADAVPNTKAKCRAAPALRIPISVPGGALEITKTPVTSTVDAGQSVAFTIRLTNTVIGGNIESARLTDTLPAGVTWSINNANTDSGSQSACAIVALTGGGQQLRCNYGNTLRNMGGFRQTRTIRVVGTSSIAQCPVIPNRVDLTWVQVQGSGGNTTRTPGQAFALAQINVRCATIEVDKVTVPVGATQPFTFTLRQGNRLLGQFSLTDAAIPYLIYPLTPTVSYSVTEGALTDWALTSQNCTGGFAPSSITPAGGDTVSCTFVNTRRTGTLIINKVAQGGNATFDFTGPGGSLGAGFQITTTGGSGSIVFNNAPTGLYTIGEGTLPVGWDFGQLECSDPTANSTVNGATATLQLGEESVTCTYTNTRRGSITITKNVDFNGFENDPAVTNQSYTICLAGVSVTYGPVCNIFTAGQTLTLNNLRPGNYQVYETTPSANDGWMIGVAPENPVVVAGQDTAVTVSNMPLQGDLVIVKTVNTRFVREYNWEITKTVDPPTLDLFVGDTGAVTYTLEIDRETRLDRDFAISGTVTISNPSALPVLINQPVDVLSQGGAIALNCGVATWPYRINAGQQVLCTYDQTLAGAFTPGDLLTNTVSVSLTNNTLFQQAVPFAFSQPTTEVDDEVTVADALAGINQTVTGDLTFSYPGSATCDAFTNWQNGGNSGSYPINNTATVSGAVNNASDSATVSVNCYRLGVTKSAQPAYDLTSTWDITKTVDLPAVSLFDGDSQAVTYTVNVTNTGAYSNAWTVDGTITISNPAPLTANLASVEDILNATYSGQVSNCTPSATTIAPYGQVTCGYTIDLSSAGAVNGVNEARVVLANNDSGTTLFTGAQGVDFATAQVTPINATVTVTDSMRGALGAFSATGAATYTRTLDCAAVTGYVNGSAAALVGNVATIEQTGQSDAEEVTLNCYRPLVAKSASTDYTRTFTWTVEKSAAPARLDLFDGESGVVTYTVNVTKSAAVDSAFRVTGAISITNPHPTQPATFAVVDVLPGGLAATVDCGSGATSLTVGGGSSANCTYTATPAGFLSGANVVTATMNTQAGPRSYSGQAAVNFDANNPTTVVDNQVGIGDTNAAFGDDVTTDATFVRVYPVTYGCQDVDFGQSTTRYQQQTNTVNVDKTVDSNFTAAVDLYCYLPTISKTAQGAFGESYDWAIVKRANPERLDLFEGESQVVSYTIDVTRTLASQADFQLFGGITITNPNPARSLALTGVVDQLHTGQVLPNNCAASIAPGQTLTCAYGGSVTGVTANSIVTNTATVSTTAGRSYTSSPVSLDFGQVAPSQLFTAVTIVDSQTELTWPMTGSGQISYTLPQGCADVAFADGSTTYNATLANTASVRELVNRTSTANVALNCYRLGVSKDANESFTRRYLWDVTKTVTPATWDIFVGDRVTSTYTVTANIVSYEDSGWQVDGTITLANPAPMPAAVTNVVDVLPNGVAATVDCGGGATGVTIPANSSAACSYRGQPGGVIAGDNLVTATLQTSAGSNQYSGAAPVIFGAPTTELSTTVSVTDTPYGPLGSFSDGQSTTYAMGFSCADVVFAEGATSTSYLFDNTAAIDGTRTSDSQQVAVTCWKPPVLKTAITRYNRVFDYDVEKTAEPAEQTIYYTDTATFAYTLQVTKYIAEENGFAVAGTIVISNAAPIDATLASIEDILPDAVNMTVNCAPDATPPYVVPAGGEVRCTYSAGLPDKSLRTNTAQATLANGTVVSTTAAVDFSQAIVTPLNDSAAITDTYFSEVWTVYTTTQRAYTQSFTCEGAAYDEESGFFRKTLTNIATVLLPNGDSDSATVTLNCYQVGLNVQKRATPSELVEPGGLVTFDVAVVNTSPVPVQLTSLTDSIYGDITQVTGRMTSTTCALPQSPLPANGGQYQCSFTANLTGQPGFTETDIVTVTGIDEEGAPVTGGDDATVSITNSPSSLSLAKTASQNELPWPGGVVTFTVAVTNPSAVDVVTIDTLTDSIYGDLTQSGGKIIATTCRAPQVLASNATYRCAFAVNLTLAAEATANLVETNVVTATGSDDDGNPLQASDSETVTVIAAPRATIGDRVFVDIDPDGDNSATIIGGNQRQDFVDGQPVESNVPGIYVLLFTADGQLVVYTQTDADGAYSFPDVPPGDYYVVFVNDGAFPGAWVGYDAQISDTENSDVDPTLPLDPAVETVIEQLLGTGASDDAARTPVFTITPGQTYLDLDAGLIDLSGASSVDINGVAWLDANKDGVRQPEEEVRVPGLIVELYRVDSSQPNGLLMIDQAATDGSGYFEFLGLDAGVYLVKIITGNLQISPQNAGDDSTIDSDVDPLTGESALLTLTNTTATVDVGVYQLPTSLDPVEEPTVYSFTIFLPAIQQ